MSCSRVSEEELVATLLPLNGKYFSIQNIDEYAAKISTLGKCLARGDEETNRLLSYVLYYDNTDVIFVSMVWTDSDFQGRGLARKLLRELVKSSSKEIRLEVHRENPAKKMYEGLGFTQQSSLDDSCHMRFKRRAAIMQPYVFPYIGYFHLIEASDCFVFYNDVNYITRGWINRNRILVKGKDHRFTIPVIDASQNRLINDTKLKIDENWKNKFYATLAHGYSKAPFYQKVSLAPHRKLSIRPYTSTMLLPCSLPQYGCKRR